MEQEAKILSQEELQAWKADPTTRVIWEVLRKWKESLKDQWASGQFQTEDLTRSAIATTGALAQVQLLDRLLELDQTEIEETLREES